MLAEQITQAKEPIISCEQCGMCSSACPITGVEGFNIRRIERAVQLGAVDDLLHSQIPWLCTTCGRCETACPNGYRVMTTTRTLRRMMPPELTPPAAACRVACPAGMDAPRYIRLIAEGKFDAAYSVIRETAPMPGILGRACAHPCEEQCRRAAVDQSISICALKRFAADQAEADFPPVATAADSGRRVAVVGSGPAGLTAAFYLRKKGHAVTLLEAREQAGGMLRYGIPTYRLPQEVLDREIGDILAMGVDFRPGTALGEQTTIEQLQAEYDAVLLAVGAQSSRDLDLEGADRPNVLLGALEYLADVRAGREVALKGRVVVIGGGSAAMDAARTALRLGAEQVSVVYRRQREAMPALPEELEQALEEGVVLYDGAIVHAAQSAGDGETLSCACQKVTIDTAAPHGTLRLLPVEGGEFTLEADVIIAAIGQEPALSFLDPKGPVRMMGGLIDVDLATQVTGLAGVFAAGDAASRAAGQPGTIISAIAAGRRAAAAIDRHLGGDGEIGETLYAGDTAAGYSGEREEGFAYKSRLSEPTLPLPERAGSFVEVNCGFNAETAMAEAGRCLNCDLEIAMARNGGPPA